VASQQANATRRILNAANRALSYCATFNENHIVYHACDMALHVFADASYLCRLHSRSVAGAIFFLGNHNDPTRINGSIHVFSSIIPCIVASAGEAEYAALFAAGQHAARSIHKDNSFGPGLSSEPHNHHVRQHIGHQHRNGQHQAEAI
jgi:hypothetical protein